MSSSIFHYLVRFSGRIGLCFALVCAIALVAPTPAAAADIIYVSASAGSDVTGNGTTADPYRSIRKGLSLAAYGDCVRIMPGDYSTASSGETFPLSIPRGVRVQGTGALEQTKVLGDGLHSVFSIVNGDENTVLEGLAITDGGGVTGGGVNIVGGSSPGWGPVVQRNWITENAVTGNGGGIAVNKGAAASCTPLIRSNYLMANQADSGGGISFTQAVPNVTRCIFISNRATGHYGGGLFAQNGPSGTVERCYFFGNSGPSLGGGLTISFCGPTNVIDSVFFMNRALYGGGAYNTDSPMLLENCVFTSNHADDIGGGIYCYEGNTSINLCSLTHNDATSVGDGIRQYGASGILSLTNSMLWDNNGDDVEGTIAASYSLTQEAGISGTGVRHDDPRIRALDSIVPYVLAGSPCIDTGNPAIVGGHDFEQIARPQDGDGNGSKRVDMGAIEFWVDVQRDSGSTRYSTATEMWGDRMIMTHHVVIATGLNFPDALCASGLAGVYGAPILLTKPDVLPPEVVNALEKNETYEAFIVGGSDVVHESVVAQLEGMGIDVVRLSGDTRYETSKAVADHIEAVRDPDLCLIARGDLFPDALALSPVAWTQLGPVLLVKPDSVPATTRAALDHNAYVRALIGGDTTAVSAGVETTVKSYVGAANVTRLGGTTRYETAAEIGEYAISQGWLGPEFFGIATGENFPDALAGGAVCGYEDGPLLLTKKDTLRPAARQLMMANQDELREIYLFGGSDVVSDQVMDDCAQLMP